MKRNILEILGIKIDQKLISGLVETSKENNFTDYTTEIIENFELFDTAIFRTFDNSKNLLESTSFNLILENKNQSVTISKISEFVDTITLEYGEDRRGLLLWTDDDNSTISTYWLGREWIVNKHGETFREFSAGCSQINFRYDNEYGIGLSILVANMHV